MNERAGSHGQNTSGTTTGDSAMDDQTARLYATTDAQVWAREFMTNFGHRLDEIDEGLMIGWFANLAETAKAHALPPERSDTPPEGEYVVLPRSALLEFFGKMALPPWTERGKVIGGSIDCAPIASEIIEWIEAHDLTGVVHA